MSLFKNLYLDLSFINPFKKKTSQLVLEVPEPPPKKMRELPSVSKKLLDQSQIKTEENIKVELPRIKKPIMPPPSMNSSASTRTNDSFFSNLYTNLSKDETHATIPGQVISKDLFGEMQAYWKNKKEEIEKTAISNSIKGDFLKKIEELQNLEVDWQKLQLHHEKIKDELASREITIENNIRQLKKSFKRLHLSQHIKPEHYFMLFNGTQLRNLQELSDSLKHMDMNVFYRHVNNNTNDFANWVNDIMGLSDLAQNMRNSQTKEQMSDLIEKWYYSG